MPNNFDRLTPFEMPVTQYLWESVSDEYGNWLYDRMTGQQTTYQTIWSERHQRTYWGVRTPNYRSIRKANGWLPTNPCEDLIIRLKGIPVVQHAYNVNNGQRRRVSTRTDASYRPITLPSYDFSGLNDEAWSKLRRKVLDQDFNAPVFLAEAGKTVNMIIDRARSLARAYRAFRRGRFAEVGRVLGLSRKTRHNTWLEYKYGWLPLLSDIHGGAKTLAELDFKRDIRRFTTTARYGRDWSSGDTKGQWEYLAKAWVIVKVRSPSLDLANRVGLLNPFLVAWELVPLSFVADWFVNIGDCIAEATAFSNVTILTGGRSYLTVGRGIVTELNPAPYEEPGKSMYEYRKFWRDPGVFPMPSLRIKSNPLKLDRLVTAAALLKQRFR